MFLLVFGVLCNLAIAQKESQIIERLRFTNSIGIEFVWVPPGSFVMGEIDQPDKSSSMSHSKGFLLSLIKKKGQRALFLHIM